MMKLPLLPTTIVGSYPQPDWLIDRVRLKDRLPPRVRAKELWRMPENLLAVAQDDATVLAIHDQERAGIDIVGDGEMRRESYSNRLANALSGIDEEKPGSALDRTGNPNPVPRVAGPIKRLGPIEVQDVALLKRNTDRPIKITIPGPFTMTQQAQNDYYKDDEALAMDYAAAVNQEIKDLHAAGCDVVQLDEPYLQARSEKAKHYAVKAINKALEGVTGKTALHICFGYSYVIDSHGHDAKPNGYAYLRELEDTKIDVISLEAAEPGLDPAVLKELPNKTVMYGVIDMHNPEVETAQLVAERLRGALKYKSADKIWVAPDCGMKYISRETAFGKLKAMVEGARIVRKELGV